MNKIKNKKEDFEILRKISKKPDSSQRELSKELGYSSAVKREANGGSAFFGAQGPAFYVSELDYNYIKTKLN